MVGIRVLAYIILTVAVFNTVQCDDKQAALWRAHSKRFANFLCSVPQPRSIHLKELTNRTQVPDLDSGKILPSSTVLHRCGSAGCCPAKKKCLPTAKEEVTLLFLNTAGRSFDYIEIKAENHTHCGCEDQINMPK